MNSDCSLETRTSHAVCETVPIPRKAAAYAWWGLLAGYLIFNRQFAVIGVPPVYIGEATIALALLVHAPQLPRTLITTLKQSWAMRFIALFLVYGALGAMINFSEFRVLALRDSVICLYAIAAFLTPLLLQDLIASPGIDPRISIKLLAVHALAFMRPIATAATAFSGAIVLGYYSVDPWHDVKVDYIAAATAICAWLWLISALKWMLTDGESAENSRTLKIIAGFLIAIGAAYFVAKIPVRAVWYSAFPLMAFAGLAFARSRRGRVIVCASVVIAVAIVAPSRFEKARILFGGVNQQYKLNENLTNVVDANANQTSRPGELEKIMADNQMRAVSEDEMKKSLNVVWRAVFWTRAWNYTVHNAPLTGIGFGENLTNLMRGTPAWPLFVPSMQLNPPNRSPHNAHVTIFTRLGFAGLAIWIMILGCVAWNSLNALWTLRASADAHAQALFFSGLGILGVWLIFLCAMSFGVVLEGPMGGIWFWSVTGLLACWSKAVCSEKCEAATA